MPYGLTHWQTLKDSAIQLPIKYKSGALATQYKCEDDIPYWSIKTNISQKYRKPVTADCVGEGVKAGLASTNWNIFMILSIYLFVEDIFHILQKCGAILAIF